MKMGPCHQWGRIFKRTASLDFYVDLTGFSILNSNVGCGAGCSSHQPPPSGEGSQNPTSDAGGRTPAHSHHTLQGPEAKVFGPRSTGPGCERWLCSLLCDHSGATTLSGPPCARCEVTAPTDQLISAESFPCEMASLSDIVALSPPLLPPCPGLSSLTWTSAALSSRASHPTAAKTKMRIRSCHCPG